MLLLFGIDCFIEKQSVDILEELVFKKVMKRSSIDQPNTAHSDLVMDRIMVGRTDEFRFPSKGWPTFIS